MRQSHYQSKSIGYGISRTRLRKILELVGSLHGKRVLDVGCATGYLGSRIKDMGNYVVGVEISEPAAREARSILNEVYVFDIENEWPDKLLMQRFDLAILAETLEHVFSPAEVLEKTRNILKDGGEIIITTPNFMTWTNRLKFLFGQFRYKDQGMFDFGHIRFFTYNYLKEVLVKSGFELARENHILFPGKLSKIIKVRPSFFANQFIIKAKKT